MQEGNEYVMTLKGVDEVIESLTYVNEGIENLLIFSKNGSVFNMNDQNDIREMGDILPGALKIALRKKKYFVCIQTPA